MNRTHQPDEEKFRAILPEQIEWRPFPAFPPGVSLAILVGHPTETGPYLIRVKAPLGLEYANASDDPRQPTLPR